jgi:glycerophosphoryl diester phosphodiesterase
MPKRILQISLAALAAGALVCGAMWLAARPAAPHPYFSRTDLRVIAHRGGRGMGPENTLTAFRISLAAGADVLEMDVRTTADGHLVIIHDDSVDRTTDGRGAVQGMTLAQLKKLDAGYRWTKDAGRSFPFKNHGVTIPTLAEVFEATAGTPLIVELKEDRPAAGRSLCNELGRYNRTADVLVASAHMEVIESFRSACPSVATAAGPAEALRFYLLSRMGLSFLYSPIEQALLIPKTVKGRELVTPAFVKAAHGRNLNVSVWTVNAEVEMRQLIRTGVNGIITDYPDRLALVVGKNPELSNILTSLRQVEEFNELRQTWRKGR